MADPAPSPETIANFRRAKRAALNSSGLLSEVGVAGAQYKRCAEHVKVNPNDLDARLRLFDCAATCAAAHAGYAQALQHWVDMARPMYQFLKDHGIAIDLSADATPEPEETA